CYFYEGQTYYSKIGETEYSTSNNTLGTPCTLSNLNSSDFYTNTLGWSAEIWSFESLDFANGIYPTLRDI
ncbi:MAG: hypothetical protein LBC13_01650, partial [Clostridiales bacterium]|nr:hypothetical protein [Clostridiales bacterium]